MDDPSTAGSIIISIVLVILSFIISMAENAISNVSGKTIDELADDGNKSALRIKKLEEKNKVTSTAQTLFFINSTVITALMMVSFCGPLALVLSPETVVTSLAKYSALLIIVLSVLAVQFIIGFIVPRKIGYQSSLKVSLSLSGFLGFLTVVFTPLIAFLSGFSGLIIAICGFDPHKTEEDVTEENIRDMVDELADEKGEIEISQKEMINNIFEFDDLVAGDVMTHRTDIEAVEIQSSIGDVVALAIEEGYSRIPVYEEELDNLKGIIYVKDLLRFVGNAESETTQLSDIMRQAFFIPESKKCGDLFTEMTEKHIQMAVVSDEYGGIAGIVTIEDLIESIVGNIQDEFDDEQEDFEQITEDVFNVDGVSEIESIEDLVGVKFPEGEYDTVAGFIMSVLGKIPEKNEHPEIEYDGFKFTVGEMDERRINRVVIERLNIEEDLEPSEE